MSYCIEQRGGSIVLPSSNVSFALDALKRWMREEQECDDWDRFRNFEDIAHEFGLMVTFDEDKNEYFIDNEGEKLLLQEEFLEVIAEFCNEDSYIELLGEDGHLWRFVIKDGRLLVRSPSINWHQNTIEADSICRAKELIRNMYLKKDSCLGEVLTSVSVVGLTIKEILELADDLKYEVEGKDKAEKRM